MRETKTKIRSLFLTALMVFSVFAGTVALTGGAAAANLDTGTYYSGQEVTVQNLNAETTYQVRTVDTSDGDSVGSLRRTISTGTGETTATFTLDGRLSEGTFTVVPEDSPNTPIDLNEDGNNDVSSDQFEVIPQDLTAEFDDDTVGTSGDSANVDFEVESDVRNNYAVNVSAEGLDRDELAGLFANTNAEVVTTQENLVDVNDPEAFIEDTEKVQITNPEAGPFNLDFSGVDAGNYTFETNVTDADASDADTIEVVSTDDASVGFAQSVVEENRGDVAEVTVQLENTDTGLIQIGTDDDDGYHLTAEVTDGNDDGEVTVEFNSFLAGAVAGDQVVSVADDDDSVDALSQGGDFTEADGEDRPAGEDVLAATDYDLLAAAGSETSNAYDSENGNISDEEAFATLSLTERSTDDVQVWTAPNSALNDELEDAEASDVYSLVESDNLTQTDTIAQGDAVVVQVEASGLEGAIESADSPLAAYQAYTADSATPEGPVFSHVIEGSATTANTDAEETSVLDLASTDVIYDEQNDTHFVVFNSNDLDSEDGDEYEANFTMTDNTDLSDENVVVNDTFTVEDRDATLNNGNTITVEAADGQEVSGTTNVAPGTELTVRMRSTTSGSPFLVQPTTYVGANGSYTATADFSEYSPGANFTAQTRLGSNNIGDDVDGSIVEATNETDNGTATPTPGTETPTDGTPTETATDGGVTETATEGGASPTDGGMSPTEGGSPAAGTETPTSGDGPGFTAVVALVALVAAALLAVRRDN